MHEKMTIETKRLLGQKIVDMISDECERAGTVDMNGVLNVLVSVVGHYIGGIGDLDARQQVYDQFGGWLAQQLTGMAVTGAPGAHVLIEGKDSVQ